MDFRAFGIHAPIIYLRSSGRKAAAPARRAVTASGSEYRKT
jgi:hypothetical protein